MYRSIFLKTAGALALTALLTAQGYNWACDAADNCAALSSASLLAFALGVALLGGLIAVGWSFYRTPAVTPLGRGIRNAIQAVLSAPIVAALLNVKNGRDVFVLAPLIGPTIGAVILAFAIGYIGNSGTPVPIADSTTAPTVAADVVG